MTSIEKREAILQAALRLIAERGFHDTPMSLIAKESGASAGTIYHHFVDKDDMIHSLYRSVKESFNHALAAGNTWAMPLDSAFRRLWLNAYHFYHTHPIEAQFLDQYENSPYFHPEVSLGVMREEEHFPELLQLFFDDTQPPVLKDLPLDVLQELTFGVAARVAKHRRAGLPTLDESTLESIADACYQAVKL